jgi:hypothetical protein
MNNSNKQVAFWSFCLILVMGGLIIVASQWKGNSFYIKPYQAVDAKVKKQRAKYDESSSNQPQAPGMRESDIKKAKGKGYSTY